MFTAGNNHKSSGGLPPTNPKGGFGSSTSAHSNKLASLANSIVPTPAIPGRTIRIIVNKQNSVSVSKTANRCFNRSDGKSVGGPGTGLHKDTSFDSKMSKSTAYSSEGSTFLKSSPAAQPFNSTVKRFDANYDYLKMFNRDPGPGSY